MAAEGRSILVTLDKERHLKYDINALAAVEQVTGLNLALPVRIDRINLTAIRAFLWAGLKHEDDTLSILATGDLIQTFVAAGGDMAALAGKMREALELSGFKAKEPGAASPLPAPESGSPPPSA